MTIEKELQAIISKEVEKQLVNRHIASKSWTLSAINQKLTSTSREAYQIRLDSQQKQINKLFAEVREGKKKVAYAEFTVQGPARFDAMKKYYIADEPVYDCDSRYVHKDGTVSKICGKENFFSTRQEAQDFLDGLQGKKEHDVSWIGRGMALHKAEADKIANNKPKLPRVGQLCYVWDFGDAFKSTRRFSFIGKISHNFIDEQKKAWDKWSFIPTEDIL